jgi:hypothetical protein
MPGLKQAGIIANQRLCKHLAVYGYAPAKRTPALWTHATRPITFTLVVDDFGIKYVLGQQHANHLINSIKAMYNMSLDWTSSLYCGLTLAWDYDKRTVLTYQCPATLRPHFTNFNIRRPARSRMRRMTGTSLSMA